jgi:hypothetical protein
MSDVEDLGKYVDRLAAAIDRLTASRIVRAEAPPTSKLRNVYTVEQFAAEILCGNRHANWVRNRCQAKIIKTVTQKPFLIPQSEAMRMITASGDARKSRLF